MASLKEPASLDKIQEEIWSATLPLEIRLSSSESRLYDKTDAYLVSTGCTIRLDFTSCLCSLRTPTAQTTQSAQGITDQGV